jgi:TPR repeat protein
MQNDTKSIFEFCKKSADLGEDIQHSHNTGYNYANGIGTTQDYKKAAYYYKLAIDRGDKKDKIQVGSLFNLSDLYRRGKGVELNYQKAYELCKCAAEVGNAEAQEKLGYCYAYGKYGVQTDRKKAIEWLEKASKQNFSYANVQLAINYRFRREETGLYQHTKEKEINLLKKGIAQGVKGAEDFLRKFY